MYRKRKTGGWRAESIRQDPTDSRNRVEISPTQTKNFHTQTGVKKMVKKLSRLCLYHNYTSNPNTTIPSNPLRSLSLSLYNTYIYIFVSIRRLVISASIASSFSSILFPIALFIYFLHRFLTIRLSCLSDCFLLAR